MKNTKHCTHRRFSRLKEKHIISTLTELMLLINLVPTNATAGKILLDCGGTVDGFEFIKGCFCAHNSTRYINLENGLMQHPDGTFAVKMENHKKCSMILNPQMDLSFGNYQCGSILNGPNRQDKFILFASFDLTRTEKEIIVENVTDSEGYEEHEDQNKLRNATQTIQGTPKSNLFIDISTWIQIIAIGVFLLILTIFAKLLFKRLRKSELRMGRISEREWMFRPNYSDNTISPPMEIIPTDSLSRWTGNRRKETTLPRSSCACLQEPFPSLDPVVFV